MHKQYAVTVHYTLGNRTHTKTRALTFHFQNSCKSFALRLFIMSKCIRWNFLAKNDWMHGCFCLLLLKSNARDIYPRYAIYRQWIRKMLIAAFIRARLSFHNLFIIQVFRWKKNCTHYVYNNNSVNFLTMQKMASAENEDKNRVMESFRSNINFQSTNYGMHI